MMPHVGMRAMYKTLVVYQIVKAPFINAFSCCFPLCQVAVNKETSFPDHSQISGTSVIKRYGDTLTSVILESEEERERKRGTARPVCLLSVALCSTGSQGKA